MTEELKQRCKVAAEKAQLKFLEEVVRHFPETASGDFPPDATFAFDAACEKAVASWAYWNVQN